MLTDFWEIRTPRNYANKYATLFGCSQRLIAHTLQFAPPSSHCHSNGTLIMLNALCCYFNLRCYKQEFSPTMPKNEEGNLAKGFRLLPWYTYKPLTQLLNPSGVFEITSFCWFWVCVYEYVSAQQKKFQTTTQTKLKNQQPYKQKLYPPACSCSCTHNYSWRFDFGLIHTVGNLSAIPLFNHFSLLWNKEVSEGSQAQQIKTKGLEMNILHVITYLVKFPPKLGPAKILPCFGESPWLTEQQKTEQRESKCWSENKASALLRAKT